MHLCTVSCKLTKPCGDHLKFVSIFVKSLNIYFLFILSVDQGDFFCDLSLFCFFVVQYGVVLDAGSTHTNMFVYKWKVSDIIHGTALVKEIGQCRITDKSMAMDSDSGNSCGQWLVLSSSGSGSGNRNTNNNSSGIGSNSNGIRNSNSNIRTVWYQLRTQHHKLILKLFNSLS